MPDKPLLTVQEYAERIGRSSVAVRKKCMRGTLPGAVKVGRDWIIPADAPYPDERVTSGKYRNWRKKGRQSDPDDSESGPG